MQRKVTNYRLPREESIQSECWKIFRTDGMNWNKNHICSAHWSHGERKSINDLPDIPTPADQLQKLREKFETAKNFRKNVKLHHKNYTYDTKCQM